MTSDYGNMTLTGKCGAQRCHIVRVERSVVGNEKLKVELEQPNKQIVGQPAPYPIGYRVAARQVRWLIGRNGR